MALWITLYFPHITEGPHATLDSLANDAQRFTPNVATVPPASLVLDIQASLNFFKGPLTLCQRIKRHFKTRAPQMIMALAPTATGAQWMVWQTHSRQRRVLKLPTLQHRLDSLPLTQVPLAQPCLNWLHGIGCHTLGHLRRLPRAGLQQRTYAGLLSGLDQAYGHQPETFTWHAAPQQFFQTTETRFRRDNACLLLQDIVPLLEQACEWLALGHRVCHRLLIQFHFETGRRRQPPQTLELIRSHPGFQLHDFLPLLQEQLHAFTLTAPVAALSIHIPHTLPRTEPTGQLFPDPAQWQHDEARLIDLLSARLGPQTLTSAAPKADHRPECANIWVEYRTAVSGPPPTTSSRPYLRPFWLLPQPLALGTIGHAPAYQGHALKLMQGPERIESGWWDAAPQARDYFIAHDSRQIRYWIFRLRPTAQSTEHDHEGWFLHGFFG